MGSELSFRVLPLDGHGDVLFEHVPEPSLAVADNYIWQLLHEEEGQRLFQPVVEGLGLQWYRRTSMERCLAERRNPTRADCFEPQAIHRDLETLCQRLTNLEAALPRRFRFQMSDRIGEWSSHARVFYAGRLFEVGAGWGHCLATWSQDRPAADAVRVLLEQGPDIEHDLRQRPVFRCVEAIRRDTEWLPGGPVSLHISSQTPSEFFGPNFALMLEFCRRAETGGFVVFTNRG
jgi:hypothetical protein